MAGATATKAAEWIRTSEAARILGMTEQTVRRNAETKFHIQVRKKPRMTLREYRLADVLRFKAEMERTGK